MYPLAHAPLDKPYLDAEAVACLQARLACVEGQVGGLGRMLSRREPCEDIVIQAASVRAALESVTCKLLDGHIQMCLRVYAVSGKAEALRRLTRALELVLRN